MMLRENLIPAVLGIIYFIFGIQNASLALAYGQTTCCGPKQFQADILQQIGQYDRNKDKALIENNFVKYYYDYNNKMIAAVQNVTGISTGNFINEHIIVDFNKARMWTIRNNNCKAQKVVGSMNDPCIPDGATYLGSHKYSNMPVDFWTFKDNNGTDVRASFTKETCVLVSETLLTNGPVFNLVINFYQNITQSIKDRTVFEVPSFCPKTVFSAGVMELPVIFRRHGLTTN